jgi:hypothetical protein
MQNSSGPIKLIYVVGIGHSGSTLLDMLLDTHSRVAGIGEINMYDRYFADSGGKPYTQRLCTCGRHVEDCPQWDKVRSALRAGFGDEIHSLRGKTPEEFEEKNQVALRAFLAQSGKDWVCDSSKRPGRLQHYLESGRFDTHIIHLIRDGRATAYSYKIRAGKNLYYCVARWMKQQLGIYFRWHRHPCYLLVRYEDLADRPQETLERILDALGLAFEARQLSDWRMQTHHNLGGNKMRLYTEASIQRDKRYLSALGNFEWFLSSLLAWPALHFFGYPLRRETSD